LERLLEKSLDDQFAIERERKAVEDTLNRRVRWALLPLGVAMAIAALYIDISTRIAIPVLVELQDQVSSTGQRADYDVFRLNMSAFLRLAPSAIVAGLVAAWTAVWAGTYYRRRFVAPMYALIGIGYALILTALLGVLIPLNSLLLRQIGLEITDAEIPHSSEISLLSNDLVALSPFSYLVTGMERGIWAAAALIIFGLVGMRLAGSISSVGRTARAVGINTVLAVVAVLALFSGPIGIHQFLFDRMVQPPSESTLGFQFTGESPPPSAP
jgi:hypothetical protein